MNISVIIPTYNRASFLTHSIQSVLNQKRLPKELIVVDDGSTDHTSSIVDQFVKKSDEVDIIYLRTNNQGVSHARNLGIQKSKHKWIAFLDSDDQWLPQKLQKQVELIHSSPDLRIVHGDERWIRNGRFVNQMKKHKKFGGNIYEKCLARCLISPSCVMMHRDIFDEYGMFRQDFEVCEDYDLWLRITAFEEVGFVEEPIIEKYGGHECQLSRKYQVMDWWRVLALMDMLKKELTEEQRQATVEEIKFKASILKTGMDKRGNKEGIALLDQTIQSGDFH